MNTVAAILDNMALRKKVLVTFDVIFDTAWRIGSGKEGETLSDLGVVLDPLGQPVLPGSSLKGRLRSTCECLAHALNMTACMLNQQATGVNCTSDVKYYHHVRESYRRSTEQGIQARLQWIERHTCDVCMLFGSPVMASRIQISDGVLQDWAEVVQIRDGVVIDRDSQTAVDGLKYDYEVVPPGSRFAVTIDLDNPSNKDLALFGAALFEWAGGNVLGGFKSRGLGRFHLDNISVRGVDLSDPQQKIRFLTHTEPKDRLSDLGNWEEYFSQRIHEVLSNS
ncbi:MAG: CRISPR-associated RAMP protein [Pirellulaceae bacterium]|nr:MAG: CRISPR-associated RAMP protein [Pirellulaceae bacterium]